MPLLPVGQISLGPSVVRWLGLPDLNFPDSGYQMEALAPVPSGLVTDNGWLVFHRCQVVLIVPDEVHSYWHRQATPPDWTVKVHQVEGSEWLTSFDQQHLSRCRHFVIDLRDRVIEVICERLLFGAGEFELETAIDAYPALADAYYWRGVQREKHGDPGAIADFERVARSEGAFFQTSAREHLDRVRAT